MASNAFDDWVFGGEFSDAAYIAQAKRNAVRNNDAIELLGIFLAEAVEENIKYVMANTDWEPGEPHVETARAWAWQVADTYIRYMVRKKLRQVPNN